jgi:hypothetical protein
MFNAGAATMKRIALLILTSSLLTGCPSNLLVRVPGHLYQIEGSLTAQTPVPTYKVIMDGVGNSGTMTATLRDGEVCSGRWAPLRQDDPSAGQLSAVWDRVYGEGFFVAHILGASGDYRAVLAGNKGTTVTVEFYGLNAAQMSDVRGVAEDNNGNVFKLTF